MNIDYKIIGERIKVIRRKKGLTQEDLAEEMDVTVAYLSRIENGRSTINLKRLLEVCNILETNPGELLLGVSLEDKSYLSKELSEVLKKCDMEKQRLIYEIAKLVEECY